MWKRVLAIVFAYAIGMSGYASANTDFLIDSIHTTLQIPSGFQAELIEDDDMIIVEIRETNQDATQYFITYSYDEATRAYKNVKDMPKKLKQQLQSFYSTIIHGETTIEYLFSEVPVLMINGLGADSNYYAVIVYYMNGFQMTSYAIKENDFTEEEFENVLYFAREGIIGVVNAMRFE